MQAASYGLQLPTRGVAEQQLCLQAHEYDCLLLEFIFGQRPDDAQKVKAFVLETIASDPGLQQAELVFLGLFGRACRILESPDSRVRAAAQGGCST